MPWLVGGLAIHTSARGPARARAKGRPNEIQAFQLFTEDEPSAPLPELRTARERPIQRSACRRRGLSESWCAAARCVDSTPSRKRPLSCRWKSPGIDEPTSGAPPANRLRSSADPAIDGRARRSRGKRLISSSSKPLTKTRDLRRNSQPARAGDRRHAVFGYSYRRGGPARRSWDEPAEEDR